LEGVVRALSVFVFLRYEEENEVVFSVFVSSLCVSSKTSVLLGVEGAEGVVEEDIVVISSAAEAGANGVVSIS
jgi:predicted TIM-barrel enzyme